MPTPASEHEIVMSFLNSRVEFQDPDPVLHRIEMHIPVRGVGHRHLDEGQRTAVCIEEC